MAELIEKCKSEGISFKKGDLKNPEKYTFMTIPHIVIADGAGKQLFAFESKSLVGAHKEKKLASTVIAKAKSFK